MMLRGLAIWSGVGIGHLAVLGSLWSGASPTAPAPSWMLVDLHPVPLRMVASAPLAASVNPAAPSQGEEVSAVAPPTAPRVAPAPPSASPSTVSAATDEVSPPVPATAPRFLTRVEPAYPPRALRAGAEGVVTLRLRLSAEGRLLAASVAVASGEPLLDEAALAAARASRYEPATVDGRPVASETTADYRFELR